MIFSLLVFVAANIYVGEKGLLLINAIIPKVNIYLYWVLFVFIVFSFVLGKIGKNKIPLFLEKSLNIVGGYWMSAFLYFIILLGVIDTIKFIFGIKIFSYIGTSSLLKIY